MRAPLVANPPISGGNRSAINKILGIISYGKLSQLSGDYVLATYHIFDNFQALVNFEFGVKQRSFHQSKFF